MESRNRWGIAIAGVTSLALDTDDHPNGVRLPGLGRVSIGGALLTLCGLVALAGFPLDKLHVAAFDTMGQVLKPKAASRTAVQHMLAPIKRTAARSTAPRCGLCIATACGSRPAPS